MKRFIKKVQELLDREYEIPVPKRTSKQKKAHYTKQPSGYINPFKHQQELEAQRLAEIQKRQREAIKKLQEQHERQKRLRQLAKPPQPDPVQKVHHTIQPVSRTHAHTDKPPTPEKATATTNKHPFLDKKIEISFKLLLLKNAKTSLKKLHQSIKNEVKISHIPDTNTSEHTAHPLLPHTQTPPRTEPVPKQTQPILHTEQVHKPAHRQKHIPLRRQHMIIGCIVLAVTLIGYFILYKHNVPAAKKPTTGQVVAPTQPANPAVKLAEAVAKQTALPQNEDPVSATVTDRNKLQNQEFFSQAQNGDKILIYKENKKAYLYRPATDEVIAAAPLVFQEDTTDHFSSASAQHE